MKLFSGLSVFAAATFFLNGCAKENQFVAPPPPEVGVQAPVIETTTVYSEYAGRTSGSSRVEIRARVKGFLQAKHFEAGQFVEEGALLFTIEPEQFEAAVATAKGNLAKAEADHEIARTNWQKLDTAFNSRNGAVPEIEVLSADAKRKAAEAEVAIAMARLADAERDLGYTEIHAPMAGRVSKELVDRGNLVGAAEPTLLTDIISVRPIYFNFEAGERKVLQYLSDMPNAENPTGSGKGKELDLLLVLSDGTEFDEIGRFDFVDNSVNPETGTIELRASFANEEGFLADGLFARLRVPETVDDAVLVPSMAIQRDLGGSYVLVVNTENVIERRPVILTPLASGDMKIIESYDEDTGTGLREADRFVVSNLQRAREGLVVEPVEKPAPVAGEGIDPGNAAPAEASRPDASGEEAR